MSDETFSSVLKYASVSKNTKSENVDTSDENTLEVLDNASIDNKPDFQCGTEDKEAKDAEVALATAHALLGIEMSKD